MLKIWGRVSSSNVQALMWCVGELGLEYERTDAGFIYGKVDTSEYRAINPNGTVPTLIDGDNPPLWETGAVLRYLASAYGEETFWPSDSVVRSGIDKWAEWSKINFAQKFTAPIFWRVVRTAPSKQDPDAINGALKELNKFLDIADHRLSLSRYLGGDFFSLADIQFGHCLYRYYDIDIARSEHGHVRRYYDELCLRPAFQEHVMISYGELEVFD